MAGPYDNPVPTRFLAPIDCLKIPALISDDVCKDDLRKHTSVYIGERTLNDVKTVRFTFEYKGLFALSYVQYRS
jgi:hypothetical protein